MFNDIPPVFVVFFGVNLISPMNQGCSKIIIYLCNNIYVSYAHYQNDTMNNTPIPDSEYLFALCITDGLLEEMDERQRASTLLTITTMKRRILQEGDNTQNETI